jgi:hypothetical protein
MSIVEPLAPGRRWRPVALALVLGLAVGCGSSNQRALPQTYPVTGTVVVQGGKPFTGGTVQFASPTTVTETVSGDIQSDGTFTLSTFNEKKKVAGAPEGEYTVTIIPLQGADQSSLPPYTLPGRYKVEAKENVFILQVPASWR